MNNTPNPAKRSRWLDWQPKARILAETAESEPTKPTEPGFVGFDGSTSTESSEACMPLIRAGSASEEAERWRRVFNAVIAKPHLHPIPVPISMATRIYGGERVRFTVVRHNCRGVNRFGEEAHHYPYALINFRSWREHPFDLRWARWYRSPADSATLPVIVSAVVAETEDRWTCAEFSDGVRVELRREGRNRWLMWVNGLRRRNFASPYLDHARRSAEHYYGKPISCWYEPRQ